MGGIAAHSPADARRFELSGGNIRNIAVNSAFLAARDKAPITMRHVIMAAKREYQKMGRLVSRAEFGPYYLVSPSSCIIILPSSSSDGLQNGHSSFIITETKGL